MKALKSDVAKSLLADPLARKKLREYMDQREPGAVRKDSFVIEIVDKDGRRIKVRPEIVPKAA
jgi:hypothetical protein